jgi:hypothetical protein
MEAAYEASSGVGLRRTTPPTNPWGKTALFDRLRRNDEAFLDALGVRSILDPTTAGDYCYFVILLVLDFRFRGFVCWAS